MLSAWHKWARAVEHQRHLARLTREYFASSPYGYPRTDNLGDADDPLVHISWELAVTQPIPPSWGVLLGDILANFRDALDHAVWAAVQQHPTHPAAPQRIHFPVALSRGQLRDERRHLQPYLAAEVWSLIEHYQPYHAAGAQLTGLGALQWLSNVDKHRFAHEVGVETVDFGETTVESVNEQAVPEVLEGWRWDGAAKHGQILARLKLRRPQGASTIDVTPIFAHILTLQVRDEPVEYRSLVSTMQVISEQVLEILVQVSHLLGAPLPDPSSLELGAEHENFAADFGGNVGRLRDVNGKVHILQLGEPSAGKAVTPPTSEEPLDRGEGPSRA